MKLKFWKPQTILYEQGLPNGIKVKEREDMRMPKKECVAGRRIRGKESRPES
jgi:hypothetical protein